MTDSDVTFYFPPYPIYVLSDYRFFAPHERHITRTCGEYVLLILFDGILNFTEEDEEVVLSSGTWYLQRPGLRQSALRESSCPRYFYIHFHMPPDLNSYAQQHVLRMPIRGKCDYRLYDSFFKELSKPLSGSLTEAIDRQTAFLNFLCFFIQTCGISGLEQKGKTTRAIIEYLKTHYMDTVELSKISAQLHYSPEYLRKRFYRETGVTIAAYVKALRIEKAKLLLCNTDAAVAEIAAVVGFEEPSVFFRNFKKQCGLSPSAWREAHRN